MLQNRAEVMDSQPMVTRLGRAAWKPFFPGSPEKESHLSPGKSLSSLHVFLG